MDGRICTTPKSLAGILKSIYLFLEGQNFIETCDALLQESLSLGFPDIRASVARLLVLRPSTAEIVRVSHIDPKDSRTDNQVQADFPILHPNKSYVLESSCYAITESCPSTKHVSVYFADAVCEHEQSQSKFRETSSAPALREDECTCNRREKVRERGPVKTLDNCLHEIEDVQILTKAIHEETKYLSEGEERGEDEDDEKDEGDEDDEKDEGDEDDGNVETEEETEVSEYSLSKTRSVNFEETREVENLSRSKTSIVSTGRSQDVTSPRSRTELSRSAPSTSKTTLGSSASVRPMSVGGKSKSQRLLESTADDITTGELKEKYSQLQNEHKSLLYVASELTSAIHSKIQDEDTDLNAVLENCKEAYPDIFEEEEREVNSLILDPVGPESILSQPSKADIASKLSSVHLISTPGTKLDETVKRSPSTDTVRTAEPKTITKTATETTVYKSQISQTSVRGEDKGISTQPSDYQQSLKKSVRMFHDLDESQIGEYSEFCYLDYGRLKKELRVCGTEQKLLLLQALRWRLTSAKPETRNNVMTAYARHDLLGINGPANKTLIEESFCPPNGQASSPLEEGMARLINTIASLTLGRDYLCQAEEVLTMLLIPLVLGTHPSKVQLDDKARNFLFVAFQKLSLRNRIRKIMIKQGLTEYLISLLNAQHSHMSDYCIEYTCALLMNLCLHQDARERVKKNSKEAVKLMTQLLESEHYTCLPYMNGIMYSLLTDDEIRKAAINGQLEKKIESKMKNTDEVTMQQMEYIRNILLNDTHDVTCSDCDCVDQDEEIDHLEPELNDGDTVKGSPQGEDLLCTFKQTGFTKGTTDANLNCLCRPMTPLRKVVKGDPCQSRWSNSESGRSQHSAITDQILEESEVNIIRTKKTKIERKSGGTPKKKRSTSEVKRSHSNASSRKNRPSSKESLKRCPGSLVSTDKSRSRVFNKHSSKMGLSGTPSKCRTMTENEKRYTENLITIEEKTRDTIFDREPAVTAPPCYTRTLINAQSRNSMRNDQAYATSAYVPVYKLCYNTPSCMTCNTPVQCQCSACLQKNRQNRYTCNCYDEMKAFIDNTEVNHTSNCPCTCGNQNRISYPTCATCSKRNEEDEDSGSDDPIRIKLKYMSPNCFEIIESTCKTSTPSVSCECYNKVFQSRPKISRSP